MTIRKSLLLLAALLLPVSLLAQEARFAIQHTNAPTGNWTSVVDAAPTTYGPITLKDFDTGSDLAWTISATSTGTVAADVWGVDSAASGAAAWVDQAIVSDEYHSVAGGGTHNFTYTLGGLDNTHTYTVQVYGSITFTGGIRDLEVESGGTTLSMDTKSNNSQHIEITGLAPAGGSITVIARTTAGSNSVTPINAIRIIDEGVADLPDSRFAFQRNFAPTGNWAYHADTVLENFGPITMVDFNTGANLPWTMSGEVISLAVGTTDSGQNSAGAGDAAWVEQAIISDEYYFLHENGGIVDLTIAGLDDGATYTIQIFGSVSFAGGVRVLETIIGGVSQTLTPNQNSTQHIEYTGLSPTGSAIVIRTKGAAGNDGAAPVNALRILEEPGGEPPPPPPPPSGADYVVDPNAGPGGVGTSEDPFDEIADCNAVLLAGEVCELRSGNYGKDPIAPVNSGTALDGPIVYRAAEGATPIIDFTETVLGGPWTLDSGTDGVDAIYRHANVSSSANHYCREETWVESGQHVMAWNRSAEWCAQEGCNTINGPGQFYFDGADILWRFSDNGNPTGKDVACFNNAGIAIELTNRNYVTVDGLTVRMADVFYDFQNSSNITFQNNKFHYGGRSNNGSNSQWVRFIGNEWRANGAFNADKGDTFIDNSDHILIKNNTSIWHGHNVFAMDNVSDVIVRNNSFGNGGRTMNFNVVPSLANTVERMTVENNDFFYTSPNDENDNPQVHRATNDTMGFRWRGGAFENAGLISAGNRYWNTAGGLWLIGQKSGSVNLEGRVVDVHIYNETCTGTRADKDGGCIVLSRRGPSEDPDDPVENNVIVNMLYHDNNGRDLHKASFMTEGAIFGAQIIGNFWDDSDGDPNFINYNWEGNGWPSNLGSDLQPDLTPQNPAVFTCGQNLTTTTAAGTDVTSIPVVDAGYFMDGYDGLDDAHQIVVGSNAAVEITEVDYVTDTITVATAITFANGDPVNRAEIVSGGDVLCGAWRGAALSIEQGSMVAHQAQYAPGENIQVTISGRVENPNSVTFAGILESFLIADNSESTIAGIPLSDFVFNGDHEQTRFDEPYPLQVNFPTEESLTTTISILGGGFFYAATGNAPGGIHDPITEVGDEVYVEVTQGTVSNISTEGVVSPLQVPVRLERRWFDLSLSGGEVIGWSTVDEILFEATRLTERCATGFYHQLGWCPAVLLAFATTNVAATTATLNYSIDRADGTTYSCVVPAEAQLGSCAAVIDCDGVGEVSGTPDAVDASGQRSVEILGLIPQTPYRGQFCNINPSGWASNLATSPIFETAEAP